MGAPIPRSAQTRGVAPQAGETLLPAPALSLVAVDGTLLRRPVPAWARVADQCQRSLRRPLPVGADLAVAAVTVAVLSGSLLALAVATASLAGSGLLFGVWKRRSCVQAQGVAWYVRRVTPAAAVCSVWLAACGAVRLREAATLGLVLLCALTLFKTLVWSVVSWSRRREVGLSPALVIGPEPQVADAEYRLQLYREAGLVCWRSHVTGGETYGPEESAALMGSLLATGPVDHIVCAAGDAASESLVRHVVRYAPSSVDVTVMHPVPPATAGPTRIGDAAVTCLDRPAWGGDACKRVFDVAVAVVLLSLLGPLMLVVAAAVRLDDPGPAVFRQRRTGSGNRQFTIFKFRSMVRNAEDLKREVMDRNVADGLLFKAEGDPRVTSVGNVIRRFSIDELPQLLNVIRGDMSLVGPRPLPTVFDESDPFTLVRHRVRPGITGLWQVKGANALRYEDMVDLDCFYVASRSLGLDLRILAATVPAVAIRRDPY